MRILILILISVTSIGCSQQQSDLNYTGILKIDAGTEYAAIDTPSTIGGGCTGWNTIEIRKPGMAGTGMSEVICWKRNGDQIIVTDSKSGTQTSGPAKLWSN
jgi:hypothetical protein